MNTNFSPLEITMLLHVYARLDHIEYVQYPAQQQAVARFVTCGLVHEAVNHSAAHGLKITDKGIAMVKLILNTPLPHSRSVFVDPRNDKVIE